MRAYFYANKEVRTIELYKIMDSITDGTVDFDLNIVEHNSLLQVLYNYSKAEKELYKQMYDYYKGDTDAIKNYKMVTERSNLKTNVNYLKKFIKEEVSYAVGNPLTYDSDDRDISNTLIYNMQHWDENHDEDLMKYMLIFTKVYELYSINKAGEFCSDIITPLQGYSYCDKRGNPIIFIHEWANKLDTTQVYVDVYTRKHIYHLDGSLNEREEKTIHKFGEVPISVGLLTKEGIEDSLFKDVKGLQDALETNLSDVGNEIADFRNAYLLFKGCTIDKEGLEKAKKLGIMQTGDPKSSIEWLIKNINDTFIQNALDRYVDTLYQITCHINHNEKLQSNTSSLALRSRLIALEQKCTLNINSHKNVVKKRIRLLCNYLNKKATNKSAYDNKRIIIKYTPNIPQDDLMMAQTISQLADGTISKQTARGQFSFINNPSKEGELCEAEAEKELEMIGDTYAKPAED